MNWRVLLISCAILIATPCMNGGAQAKTCAKMQKEIEELRLEYHTYATGGEDAQEKPTFEGLVEVLDKIVELKRAMRESNCKIPLRKKYHKPDN